MRKQDIEVGETYLFVATDNPTRKSLEGQPFKVVERKAVFRKLKRGTRKPIRFFNENGVGARAEELGPLPVNEYYVCHACREACKYGELAFDGDAEGGQSLCPNCGAIATVPGPDLSFANIQDPGVLAQPGEDDPEWPCVECGEGGMHQEGSTSPSGTMTIKCDHCGHTLTYP